MLEAMFNIFFSHSLSFNLYIYLLLLSYIFSILYSLRKIFNSELMSIIFYMEEVLSLHRIGISIMRQSMLSMRLCAAVCVISHELAADTSIKKQHSQTSARVEWKREKILKKTSFEVVLELVKLLYRAVGLGIW